MSLLTVVPIWRAAVMGAVALGVALMISACSSSPHEPTACTDELRGVIGVDVFDSVTNAPAAGGSVVTLAGPTIRDTTVVVVADTVTASTATDWFEDRVKAGTYSLQVSKAGYRDWRRDNIHVLANSCHVTTVLHYNVLLQH